MLEKDSSTYRVRRGALALSCAALTCVAIYTSANAADIYMPGPSGYKDGFVSWSGFYAGASIGGAWGDTRAIDQIATNGLPWKRLGDTFKAQIDGFTGSANIGNNWQSGNFVIGVEGELGYLGQSGTGTSALAANTKVSSDGSFFASIRGRLGYAFGPTLLYGTGGFFGANLNSKVFSTNGVLDTGGDGFQPGWAAGGGIEYMFRDRWSIKAEYLYYDLGRDRVGGNIGGGVVQFFDIENTGNIFRVGVNYNTHGEYVPLK
jgi:outer membrane immunogenic protein